MKIKKEQLRESARVALDQQGYSNVVMSPGPGIVPGARLAAMKDGKPCIIAVRTSSDREVALLRTPSGRWRTIPRVDLVLVAVPAEDAPAAEVLAFDKDTLIGVFDATVRATEKERRSKLSLKIPVFIPLDDVKPSKTKELRPGLKAKAVWRAVIPLGQLAAQGSATSNIDDHRARFFEHIKQQVANFIGLDVSKIDLEIRIESLRPSRRRAGIQVRGVRLFCYSHGRSRRLKAGTKR